MNLNRNFTHFFTRNSRRIMVESERFFETVATMDDDLNEKEITSSLLNMVEMDPGHDLECVADFTKKAKKKNYRIVLLNPTCIDIAFKTKATSQDYIRIRPGFGYLKAMSQCVLMVVIKPMLGRCEERPPQKDHVAILLAEAPPVDIRPVNPTKIWKDINADHGGDNVVDFRDYTKNCRKLRLNLYFILKEDEEVEETTDESDDNA